jgi:hypothetical protein
MYPYVAPNIKDSKGAQPFEQSLHPKENRLAQLPQLGALAEVISMG